MTYRSHTPTNDNVSLTMHNEYVTSENLQKSTTIMDLIKAFFRSNGNFGSGFNPLQNSFGFLRLCLATGVLVSHAYPLGGYTPEILSSISRGQLTLGGLSVYGFFSISGFLITRSMLTGSSFSKFIWNRFLRIFPGFWACLLFTVIFFVPLYCKLEGVSIRMFFQEHIQTVLGYLKNNAWLEMRQFAIPPLLAKNPHANAIDGSLWSLILEWRCYLLVLVAGLLSMLRGARGLLILLWAACYTVGILHQQKFELAASLPGWFADYQMSTLSAYFATAGAFFVLKNHIPNNRILFILACLVTFFGIREGYASLVCPISFAYIFLWLAFNLPSMFWVFDKHGDISYGVYMYAFPVQQALVLANVHTMGVTQYIFAALLPTFVLGILSYVLVEKPALRAKKFDPTFGLEKKLKSMRANKWFNTFLRPTPLIIK